MGMRIKSNLKEIFSSEKIQTNPKNRDPFSSNPTPKIETISPPVCNTFKTYFSPTFSTQRVTRQFPTDATAAVAIIYELLKRERERERERERKKIGKEQFFFPSFGTEKYSLLSQRKT